MVTRNYAHLSLQSKISGNNVKLMNLQGDTGSHNQLEGSQKYMRKDQ